MRQAGFSLVEMVIVIVLMGIMGATVGLLVDGPVRGAVEATQRAQLVDLADTALTRMTREIRLAVPNSVRATSSGGRTAIEFLRAVDGGRYRAYPVSGPMPACGALTPGTGNPLEFGCPDAGFDVLGQLRRLADLHTGADCLNNDGDCVVVYNTGQAGADVYRGEAVATLQSVADDGADDGSDLLTLTSPRLTGGNPAYGLGSPAQRFYIADTPVSFVCDPGLGTIQRYQSYPVATVQTTSPAGSEALLVNGVTSCSFNYSSGTPTRGGIATLHIRLTHPQLQEQVDLVQQVHVQNLP